MTNRAVESATQMVGLMQRNWSGTTIPALGMAESCRFGKPVLQIWKASFAVWERQCCPNGKPHSSPRTLEERLGVQRRLGKRLRPSFQFLGQAGGLVVVARRVVMRRGSL